MRAVAVPRFEGKVALVTGGSSGIGRMLSERLRQEGAAVVVADVSEPTPTDVSDATSVRECVDRLLAAHGRLDVVFSNAGILLAENVETMDEAAFDLTLAVNLKGAFLVAKHTIPYLRATRGNLVFTGSTSSLAGASGQGAYCASKAGIVGLARVLADELAKDGIRVNAVCPGWVDTPFNDPIWEYSGKGAEAKLLSGVPLHRQARAEEVVAPMLFLASDEASYITGEVLVVDGGLMAVR
jgi:meso-butanediol dehydrogenase / (S,S)-butanediol dehydrogenase / diacetyl reductase